MNVPYMTHNLITNRFFRNSEASL